MIALRRSRWIGRRHLSIGRLRISSYAAMLYLGCVAGTTAGAAIARVDGLPPGRFALATVLLLVPALAGARLWYVIQHLGSYRAEPRRLWLRSEGGMALYGGLVLGVCASIPVLPLAGLPFWGFWDATSVTMLVGAVITRIGCLMNGCCAGRPTNGRLGLWLPDHRGQWRRRIPTPLLDAGWALLLLVAVLIAAGGPERRSVVAPVFPGGRFLAAVGAYAAGRIVLQTTRQSFREERFAAADLCLSGALTIGAITMLLLKLPR